MTFEACNMKLMRSRHLDFRGAYTDSVIVVSPSPTVTWTWAQVLDLLYAGLKVFVGDQCWIEVRYVELAEEGDGLLFEDTKVVLQTFVLFLCLIVLLLLLQDMVFQGGHFWAHLDHLRFQVSVLCLKFLDVIIYLLQFLIVL